jgi:hypothetical protein
MRLWIAKAVQICVAAIIKLYGNNVVPVLSKVAISAVSPIQPVTKVFAGLHATLALSVVAGDAILLIVFVAADREIRAVHQVLNVPVYSSAALEPA